MGLSLSLLLSAWNEIVRHKLFGLTDTIEKTIMRSLSFDKEDGDMAFRTCSFHKEDSDGHSEVPSGSGKMVKERSMSFSEQEYQEAEHEASDSSKTAVPDTQSSDSISSMGKRHDVMQINKLMLLRPEPVILFSPKPVSELDAAATKLQKVYKSYRTRRNLADCAVVIEELWLVSIEPQFLAALLISGVVNLCVHGINSIVAGGRH